MSYPNEEVIGKLRAAFSGVYWLYRIVQDPIAGEISMSGQVTFSQTQPDNEIEYKELGSYVLASYKQDFHQVRYFCFDEYNLQILQNNRANLHVFQLSDIDPASIILHHSHPCKEDVYKITLEVERDVLRINYDISGPTKNYTIRTILTRNHVSDS